MARKTEDLGVLLVHGMGEQKPFEHLRITARQMASFVAAAPGLVRLSVSDEVATSGKITLDATFRRDGGDERVRLHLHEAWWADLGISGGVLEHVKFWLWGLGQWAAQAVRTGDKTRNTEQLMAVPRFGRQESTMDEPGLLHHLPARILLAGAALLATLTFFTWSAAKQLISLLARRLPEPSLIFLFLGDVKIFERPGAPGKGSLLDPDMPMRATIRRRVVREVVAMASRRYDRWYMFAHSLGTVPAYNALQETELALPNYLSKADWERLSARFKTRSPFAPAGAHPTTERMMPRRPPWLDDADGIDRHRLFEHFAGFVTYGSPLDKFAALWPRVVPLNLQTAVFPMGSEWVNLHDPTDPVAARLDAFKVPETPADSEVRHGTALVPKNFACRASLIFGVAHVRYFRPRRRNSKSMPAAIVEALISGERLTLSSAARRAAISQGEAWARVLLATVELALLGAALTVAAAALLIAIGKALPARFSEPAEQAIAAISPDLLAMLQAGGRDALAAASVVVLAVATAMIVAAGLLRLILDFIQLDRPVRASAPGRR
jgi:hypothetical protein